MMEQRPPKRARQDEEGGGGEGAPSRADALQREVFRLQRLVSLGAEEREEAREAHERERAAVERRAEAAAAREDEMRARVAFLVEEEARARAEAEAAREEAAAEASRLNKRVREAVREADAMRDAAEAARSEKRSLRRRSRADLEAAGEERGLADAEAERLRARVQRLEEELEAATGREARVAADAAAAAAAAADAARGAPGDEEQAQLVAALRAQLEVAAGHEREYRALLREVGPLRENGRRLAAAQEELAELRRAAERAKSLEAERLEAVRLCETREGELAAWRDCAGMLGLEERTAKALAQAVGDLQQQAVEARLAAPAAPPREATPAAAAAASPARAAEAEAAARAADALRAEHARVERRLKFVLKERDGLKSILASYDEEDTMGDHGRQQLERIALLEESLAEAERAATEAAATLRSREDDGGGGGTAGAAAAETERALRRELADAGEEAERLRADLRAAEAARAAADARAAAAASEPPPRVYHLGRNPLSDAMEAKRQREAADAEEQARALRAKVALLERGGGAAGVAAVEEASALRKRVARLEKEKEQGEVSRLRLKQVFASKASEFRDACYQLTGYRVNMTRPRRYEVLSMYAHAPEHVLAFQFNESGAIEMLGNDYAQSLPPALLGLVRQFSIPVFLSQHTIHLAEQQTQQ